MAVRDDTKERELGTFPAPDAADLFKFNIRQKRIVDLCNAEFDEDWFQDPMHYSTFQRALKGQPAWIDVVQVLDDLLEDQKAHPRKYLPADGPPSADELAAWMKQIAGAPWWHDVLKPSASLGSFKNWYSGTALSADKLAEIKARVDEWWARVMFAVERAELKSLGKELSARSSEGFHLRGFGRHFYALVVEDEMPIEQARVLYQDMHSALSAHLDVIDLSDPKDPLCFTTSRRDEFGREFDDMVAAGFPGAVPRESPEFDATPWYTDAFWPDRTHENGPVDLNAELWGRRYRTEMRKRWDEDARNVVVDAEITHTSSDGVTWVEATPREKQGWKSGLVDALRAERDGVESRPGYVRDLAKLENNLRRAEIELNRLLRASNTTEDQIQNARDALDAAGDLFRQERVRIRIEPL